jgi:cytochrome c oxidase subunit II
MARMTMNSKLLASIVGAAFISAPNVVLAAAGQAEPWQMNLQDPVTPVAEFINVFTNYLHIGMFLISGFVLSLLIYVMVKFNAKANPVPSKTTHHVGLEVAWTLIPVLILVVIAIPSFRLLYLQRLELDLSIS